MSIEPGKLLMGRTEIYTGRLAKALLGARKHCVRRSDVITIVKLLSSLCFRIFFYLIFVVSDELVCVKFSSYYYLQFCLMFPSRLMLLRVLIYESKWMDNVYSSCFIH